MNAASLKLTMRVLARRKVFTAISLFGVSFTLATLMVVSSVFDHAFGDHVPDPDASITLGVYTMRLAGERFISSGNPGYGFLEKQVRTLSTPEKVVIISQPESSSIYEGGRKFDLQVRNVEPGFWDLTRFRFVEGAPFSSDDDRAARQVAVINETTRDRLYGSAPALARELEFDGRTFRVVGVVKDVSAIQRTTTSDIWFPMGSKLGDGDRDQVRGGYLGLVKLKSPADKAAAQAEFATHMKEMKLPDGYTEVQSGLDTPFEAMSREMLSDNMGESRPTLLIALFLALATLFMLLPAVNLANLAISRALERSAEIGVRKAFGATGRQLIQQLLFENLVLTLLGGLISIPLSALALALVNRSGLVDYADFSVNGRVLLWGLAAAIVFSVISGIYPAWKLSRLAPAEAMRGRVS
jgi:putative ABC transport system permease protein